MKRVRKRFLLVLAVLLYLLYRSWQGYGAKMGGMGLLIYVSLGALVIFLFAERY